MGSLQRARRARNRHRASGLVLLMILSSFAAFATPVQASISNDDVAIISAIEPAPDVHFDNSDVIDWTPKIIVENQYNLNADARNIKLEICGGDYTHLASCPTSQVLKEAFAQSPSLNRSGADGDSGDCWVWMRSVVVCAAAAPASSARPAVAVASVEMIFMVPSL